jgi:L-fuconolactonase
MKIDSHQHFWKYDPSRHAWINEEMSAIRKDFQPYDLEPLLRKYQFDGCVAVQVDETEEETNYLLSLASKYSFIKGVVGWIDLKSDSLADRLHHFKQYSKLKGFRHIVQAEPDGFLSDPAFARGVKSLAEHHYSYDLLLYHHQLPEALTFLSKTEDVKIVIDHIAKPSIKTKEIDKWKAGIKAAASFQNVFCKISGMVTEAKWKEWEGEEFTPYLDCVFEAFGTDRLMYGSDWPVCLVAATYDRQLSIVEKYVLELSANEQEKIFGKNAQSFYNL